MAIPINVSELVKGNVIESTRIEYKAGFNPAHVIRSICAFANDIDNIGGGYIVLGIEEDHGVAQLPPRGLDPRDIDGILKKLLECCHAIEPLYLPVVEPVLLQGKHVIVIWVPGGHGRPYKAPADVLVNKSQWHYYIRKLSSSVVASPEAERVLFYASSTIPFDDQPNLLARPEDLSLGLMRAYLQQTGSSLYELSAQASTEELADDLHLLAGPPESRHPVNAGILLFSERVNDYFPYARIEVVDMPDPTGQGMTEQSFTGPIQQQLRDALRYLGNYAIRTRTFKEPGEAEARVVANYPFAAVEELLSNAVYHRSYQVQEPITVRITPEELEITSFPGFDRSIRDEDIARYVFRARTYRNRRLGDFLKELHLVEGRNTGYPTALQALERNGSPLPKFAMDEARGYLSVALPVHPDFAPARAARDSEYDQRIYAALADGPLTLTQLAHAMGYKGISKRLARRVDALVAERKLAKVAGPGLRVVIGLPA